MKKLAPLAIIATALLSILLVLPESAWADTVGTAIKQSDLPESSNQYTITDAGDYYLATDFEGQIYVSEGVKRVTLDLDGHTLTAPDGMAALKVGSNSATIKGGSIVQGYTGSHSMPAIQVSSGNGHVTLRDVTATANDYYCLDIANGNVTCYDCSLTSTNVSGGNYAAIHETTASNYATSCYIQNTTVDAGGADVIETSQVEKISSSVSYPTIDLGTTLSSFPMMYNEKHKAYEVVAERYVKKDSTTHEVLEDNVRLLYTAATGKYTAVTEETARKDGMYKVDTGTDLGTVYFDDKDVADSVGEKLGVTVERKLKITFNSNRGTEVAAQYAWSGDTTTEPESPTRSNYTFEYWRDADGNQFDFANTKITEDITLKAKWVPVNAVAQIVGGEQYACIQDALYDTTAGDTINLLQSTVETATIGEGQDVTIDLCGNTLTTPDDAKELAGSLVLEGDAKLTVANGTLQGADRGFSACVFIGEGTTADLTIKGVKMSGRYAPFHVLSGTIELEGTDNSISASVKGDYAMMFEGTSSAVIDGGSFEAGGIATTDDAGCVYLGGSANLDVKDGTFDDRVYVNGDNTTLTIRSGSFGRPDNASDLVSGKVFYKSSSLYDVVDAKTARENARWVVTNTDVTPNTKVYTKSRSDAQTYFDTLSHDSTMHKMHKVQLSDNGKIVKTMYLESGEEYGKFPEASEHNGYTFAGWFVDGEKVTASSSPTDDFDYEVTVLAEWTEDGKSDGSSDTPTTTPTDKPSGESKAVTPQTGDPAGVASLVAAAGVALAGIGATRRRK